MKANRIMTLVLAAAVLAVVTSGMASAASWSTSDSTWLDSNGNVNWPERCSDSGTPSVSAGTSATWDNHLRNMNGVYRWAESRWSDTMGHNGLDESSSAISGNGGRYDPAQSCPASTGFIGFTDTINVYHYYTIDKDGSGPSGSTSQSFRIV